MTYAKLDGTARIKSGQVGRRDKLRFLRGNYHLALVWPIAAIGMCAFGWYFLLTGLNADQEALERNALKQAEVVSSTHADHLTQTLEALDQIVLHVKYEWQLANAQLQLEDIASTGLFPSNAGFYVAISDRNGKVVTASVRSSKPEGVGNRQYFLAHKNASQDSLYIGAPAVGHATKRNVLHFSRRLEDQSGSFSGVVLLSVTLNYFTTNYDYTTLGGNGFVGIVGNDDIVRATRIGGTIHNPGNEALVSGFHFPTQGGSTILVGADWFTDKRTRYVGWTAVKKYPLIAMAGLDQQDVLAPYWANRAVEIREGIVATVALVFFALIAMAFSMRLAWRKRQLDVTQATYRMATEGGNEGFYIACPVGNSNGTIVDFEIIDCNQRGAELYRCRREELIGKTILT
ncbi:MAG: hypothetical protein JWQ21_1166, partial [Herminiimonas sp.]|nr:hypothetical protein [Herminiimonas sp.]